MPYSLEASNVLQLSKVPYLKPIVNHRNSTGCSERLFNIATNVPIFPFHRPIPEATE
ncbi:hypothetical protein N9Y67_02030 [Pseudomonadota bacterium]|nr:hypothetical protein [Pseudomonadota bacterium]